MNKQQLKSMLGKGAVEQVLSQIEGYARSNGKEDLLNQVVLQRNRVQGYSRHQQNDTLPQEEIQRLKNQVVDGLLSIIDTIEEEEIAEKKSGISPKWLLVPGMLVIVAIIIGYTKFSNYTEGQKSKQTATEIDDQNSSAKAGQARQVVFADGSELSFRSSGGEQVRFKFLSGRIEPADEKTVSLTISIQCENLDNYPINFWDRIFRLKTGNPGQYFAPVSQLNEVVPSRSEKTGDVVFEVPGAISKAILEVQSPFGLDQWRQIAVSIQ